MEKDEKKLRKRKRGTREESSGVSQEFAEPEAGKTGYAAFERALEVRGGPKRAKVGDREIILRKYHLTRKKLLNVMSEWKASGKFKSPYGKSVISDFLNALSDLGVDRPHSNGDVQKAMKARMDVPSRVRGGVTDWVRFNEKEPRTKHGKQTPGRIETMVRNLRKTSGSGSPFPVGRKLEQMGCCVDMFILEWFMDEPHPDADEAAKGRLVNAKYSVNYYRLNTKSTVPVIKRVTSAVQLPKF